MAPVSSFRRNPCSPRRPAAQAGRSRETQTVSETTTMSLASDAFSASTAAANDGLPISSSSF